jgi:hypothetical protein
MKVYDGGTWIAASAASQAIMVEYEYTATAGQTTFTGADDNALTLSYTAGSIIVTLNGVVLDASDYTASNGNSVVLAVGASAGDELNVRAFSTFDIANTYTQAQADAAFLPKANPSYTGTLTGGTGVINIGSGQFYKDASGNVGIGTSSPTRALTVVGTWTNTGDYLMDSGSPQFAWSSGDLRFKYGGLAGTEAMRITDGGNLLVGLTSGSPNPGVRINADGSISQGNSAGVSGYEFVSFRRSGTQIGTISQNGTTAVLYNVTSDYRLKEDITPMTGALARNALLNPVKYKWKVDGSEGEGFIAHQLQGPFPSAVSGEKDAVNADGSPRYQGIGTGPLDGHFAACVNELQIIIQEQQAIITALTARVEALEGTQP